MRVLRGRAGTVDADRAATADAVATAAAEGEPAVRVWTPHRHVAFGRRDVASDGYGAAAAAARSRGFPPVERSVGGRAVAYTGTTVAFGLAVPVADVRTGVADRYDRVTAALRRALADLGVDARPGEPDGAFCPGRHSLQCEGKLAGVAQRVRSGVALVGGVLVVDGHAAVADVLEPVYGALGVPLDPDAVGSVARAGGEADPAVVARTVESELVGDREFRVERVGHGK